MRPDGREASPPTHPRLRPREAYQGYRLDRLAPVQTGLALERYVRAVRSGQNALWATKHFDAYAVPSMNNEAAYAHGIVSSTLASFLRDPHRQGRLAHDPFSPDAEADLRSRVLTAQDVTHARRGLILAEPVMEYDERVCRLSRRARLERWRQELLGSAAMADRLVTLVHERGASLWDAPDAELFATLTACGFGTADPEDISGRYSREQRLALRLAALNAISDRTLLRRVRAALPDDASEAALVIYRMVAAMEHVPTEATPAPTLSFPPFGIALKLDEASYLRAADEHSAAITITKSNLVPFPLWSRIILLRSRADASAEARTLQHEGAHVLFASHLAVHPTEVMLESTFASLRDAPATLIPSVARRIRGLLREAARNELVAYDGRTETAERGHELLGSRWRRALVEAETSILRARVESPECTPSLGRVMEDLRTGVRRDLAHAVAFVQSDLRGVSETSAARILRVIPNPTRHILEWITGLPLAVTHVTEAVVRCDALVTEFVAVCSLAATWTPESPPAWLEDWWAFEASAHNVAQLQPVDTLVTLADLVAQKDSPLCVNVVLVLLISNLARELHDVLPGASQSMVLAATIEAARVRACERERQDGERVPGGHSWRDLSMSLAVVRDSHASADLEVQLLQVSQTCEEGIRTDPGGPFTILNLRLLTSLLVPCNESLWLKYFPREGLQVLRSSATPEGVDVLFDIAEYGPLSYRCAAMDHLGFRARTTSGLLAGLLDERRLDGQERHARMYRWFVTEIEANGPEGESLTRSALEASETMFQELEALRVVIRQRAGVVGGGGAPDDSQDQNGE